MNYSIDHYIYFSLLLILPVLLGLMYHYVRWRKSKRILFSNEKFHPLFFSKPGFFNKIFPILYGLALLFLVFAMIDLLEGSQEVQTEKKVSNVIFVLDVSNSMNTEDIQPNRLIQAKNIMLNTLPLLRNNRLGMVIFAGEAISIMPLTTDFSTLETYLPGLETNAIKVQGTDFMKALEVVSDKLKNYAETQKKVVIISDGEDNEGNEEKAIELAKKEGISIITVGVGTNEGGPIPQYEQGQLMGYISGTDGQTILSKRQTQALENMANETGGTYIDGNNLEDATKKVIEALKKQSFANKVMVKSKNANHLYQYFLAISFILFFCLFIFNPKRDFDI